MEYPINTENKNQKVIADWNAVIQLKNISYDNKSICEHLSISEIELKKLEKDYNRLMNSKNKIPNNIYKIRVLLLKPKFKVF